MKKNLMSISSLDARIFQVSFFDGQFLMWPKGETFSDAVVIGEKEGCLYRFKGHPEQALVYEEIEPSELWIQRLPHIHYKALPFVIKVVIGLQ